MNILLESDIQQNQVSFIQFGRCSSQSSNSTEDSRYQSRHEENLTQTYQDIKQTCHYQNQLIILNQMEQQSFQDQSLDISTYLQKRKAVMDWLKSYGSGFNMSRISLATAQYYADMYYHNYPYDKKQVKYVLLSLLILSSKYFDYQKLYTKDIAQFCQLDLHKLNQIELQCCQKLDFNFENNNTYAFFIDKAIKIMRQQTGIDLYEENQQVNVKLTMIYKIAEKLFCQFYEWTANEKNIWYIIQSVFENQVTNNQNSLLNLFIKHKAHPIYDLSQFTLQSKIIRATKDFTQDWKKNNEHHTRKIFQDRHRNSRYKSYSQFSIKYTQ